MSTKSGHVFSSGSWSTLIAEGPVHDLRPSAHSYSDGCSVGTGLLDHIGSTKVRGSGEQAFAEGEGRLDTRLDLVGDHTDRQTSYPKANTD